MISINKIKIYFPLLSLIFSVANLFGSSDTQRGNGMLFTPNNGQIADMYGKYRPELLYTGEGGGYKVFLEKNKIHYVLTKTNTIDNPSANDYISKLGSSPFEEKLKDEASKSIIVNIHRFDVEFLNASPAITVIEDRKVEGYKNFYYSHCPDGVTNVPSFNQLVYKNVYDNIDVVYYGGKENGLKYDLVVQPGADYKQIKLNVSGVDGLELRDNNLIFQTSVGEFMEYMPRVYQQINGKIIDVKAEYILNNSNEFGFKVGKYNKAFPLIIDPLNYWISYFGGTDDDVVNDITADVNGNMIITGSTACANFPVLPGAFQAVLKGLRDVIISKFSESGTFLWSTYYGGSSVANPIYMSEDCGFGVATNTAGEIAVVGNTYTSNFPTSAGCYQSTLSGTVDMFLLKFTPAGVRDWGTLIGGLDDMSLGGFAEEEAHSVFFTAGNEIVFSGVTSSSNFPVTNGSTINGAADISLCKFSSAGTMLASRYIGGSSAEVSYSFFPKGTDVVVDHGNNIILVSSTSSADFPVTPGAFRNVNSGAGDVILMKLDNSLGTIWSTYFGGSFSETGLSVDVDASDNIFFTGSTSSIDLPVLNAAQSIQGGGYEDVYIASFTSAGAQRWTTYNGGVDWEYNPSICIDDKDDAYIFASYEDGFIGTLAVFACAFQRNFAGFEDQYFSKYDNNGSLICNSWLGGTSEDDVDYCTGGIADYKGFIYMTSTTFGSGYPVTANAYQTATAACCSNYAGNKADITLVKICGKSCGDNSLSGATFNETYAPITICDSAQVDFTINYTPCDTRDIHYEWTFANANPSTSTLYHPTKISFKNGTHHVKLKISTPCGLDSVEKDVVVNVAKPVDYFIGDTSYCIGGHTQITINDVQTAHWTPADGVDDPNATTVNISSDNLIANYIVKGIANIGCVYTVPVNITMKANSGLVYVPNAFTPNNDNLNDIFEPKGEDVTEFDLKIYDRWGTMIFHSNNINQTWDGKLKGTIAQQDIYVWELTFKSVCTGDEEIHKMGHVLISR